MSLILKIFARKFSSYCVAELREWILGLKGKEKLMERKFVFFRGSHKSPAIPWED